MLNCRISGHALPCVHVSDGGDPMVVGNTICESRADCVGCVIAYGEVH